jgi:hypothetical protein
MLQHFEDSEVRLVQLNVHDQHHPKLFGGMNISSKARMKQVL